MSIGKLHKVLAPTARIFVQVAQGARAAGGNDKRARRSQAPLPKQTSMKGTGREK